MYKHGPNNEEKYFLYHWGKQILQTPRDRKKNYKKNKKSEIIDKKRKN